MEKKKEDVCRQAPLKYKRKEDIRGVLTSLSFCLLSSSPSSIYYIYPPSPSSPSTSLCVQYFFYCLAQFYTSENKTKKKKKSCCCWLTRMGLELGNTKSGHLYSPSSTCLPSFRIRTRKAIQAQIYYHTTQSVRAGHLYIAHVSVCERTKSPFYYFLIHVLT